MRTNRSLLLATACALPFSLVACGGGDDGGATAGPPTGTHYTYVVNNANVAPTGLKGQTYADYGLDLGSQTSSKPDGTVDNSLGQALGALLSFGFDVQGTVATALNTGSIILLVDFQTSDFTNAAASGFTVKFGANPSPAACTDPNDPTTCGQHLKGTATIGVAPDSPTDTSLTGKVVNGTFNSDPGNIGLEIAIGSTTPISLNLVHARVQATSITADGMTAKVGGLITQTELASNLAPSILSSVNNLLSAAGCKGANGDPKAMCGCTIPVSPTVSLILSGIDGDLPGTTKDCQISIPELLGFQPLQSVLVLDSCSTDSCKTADSYSIGVQVTAVKATIQ